MRGPSRSGQPTSETRSESAPVSGPQPVRRLRTDELTGHEVQTIRDLLWAAFPPGDEGFTEADWDHAIGGMHFILHHDSRIAAHASVVERELEVDGHPLRTGYVEAVGTEPSLQGRGLGTLVMRDVSDFIRNSYEIGALGTGRHHFYERLGWETWQGPTFVRTPGGLEPTHEDDGYILVLRTPRTPPVDFAAVISCDWRLGDVW
jgi:aminoglycoside 2'-N-acetyltransferase I